VGKFVLLSKYLSYLLSVAVTVNKEDNLFSQYILAVNMLDIQTNTYKLKNNMRNYARTASEHSLCFILKNLSQYLYFCIKWYQYLMFCGSWEFDQLTVLNCSMKLLSMNLYNTQKYTTKLQCKSKCILNNGNTKLNGLRHQANLNQEST
jgi:hypothetical protein